MVRFEITLQDQTIEQVEGADAYAPEGAMTTFYRFASGRETIDSWSSRVASFRTADVRMVRRHEEVGLRAVSG